MKHLSHTKYLDDDQKRRLLQTVKKESLLDKKEGRTTWPKIQMMIRLAIGSGLRVSELAGLKVQHLHLGRQPRLNIFDGKGAKDRTVYIDNELKRRLKDYIQDNRLAGEDWLLSCNGSQYSRRALQNQFKKAIGRAGIDNGTENNFSIHALRHTYATYLYEKTGDLGKVQQQLGHSSIQTTRIYAKDTPKSMSEAVAGLSNYLESPESDI